MNLSSLPVLLIPVVALGFLFWLWMLVVCLSKESPEGNERLTWVVVLVTVTFVGACLYYFMRRPERHAQLGR